MAGQNKHAKFARDFTCLFSGGVLMSYTIGNSCANGVAAETQIRANRSAICAIMSVGQKAFSAFGTIGYGVSITKINADTCTIVTEMVQGKPYVCRPPSLPAASPNSNLSITFTRNLANRSINGIINSNQNTILSNSICINLFDTNGNNIYIPVTLSGTGVTRSIPPNTPISMSFDTSNNLDSIGFQGVVISVNTVTPGIPPANTTNYTGATMGDLATITNLKSSPFGPININSQITITIYGTIYSDTQSFTGTPKYYATGTISRPPPPLPKQNPTLATSGGYMNAVQGTFTTAMPAGRQLYISINNNGTIASFSYTTTANSSTTFTLDFTSGASGSSSFRMGTDAAISLTGATLLQTAQLNGAVPSSTVTAFSINQFTNASFTISFYDPVDTTTPLMGAATWTQTVTNLRLDNYVIFMQNSEQQNKYAGVLSTTSTLRPIIVRPILDTTTGEYTINQLNYPDNTSGNKWFIYDKYINDSGIITPIPQVGAQSDNYRVLLKSMPQVLTQNTNGTISFNNIAPNSSINSAPYKVIFRRYLNQSQSLLLSNIDNYTKCYVELGPSTAFNGRPYNAYPQSMQIKVDISGGESQTVNIPAVDTDTNTFTITYGASPICALGTKTVAFSKPINISDTITVSVYILDTTGAPITVTNNREGYFARGTIIGIIPPAKADGQIIREEADNGTRIKLQLPAGKSLLAGTTLQISAATTDSSAAQTATIPLQAIATGATEMYVRFYNTQGTNNAFIDINNTSYPLTPAITSDVINYYSKLTVYAYRAPFATTLTADYDYRFTTAATPEPNKFEYITTTASTTSAITLTGNSSTSLPGRSNNFPTYIKISISAKFASFTKEIPYTCTTPASSFTVSTLSPTSTDTTTEATIQFGNNPAVSLGTVLTSSDQIMLTIDDAISEGARVYQRYAYMPSSIIVFGTRSSASITGSIKQSVNQTRGYRNIPRQATFEFAIQGSGSSPAQTVAVSPKLALTVDAPEFTLSFSVGTDAAQLTVGAQTVPLTGVTLYNYHTFTLTIKDATMGEFARGISTSECRWDDCKAAMEDARRTYTEFDATTSPICAGCFLTDSYKPCSTDPPGDCLNEQNRRTASFMKWSGSEIDKCRTCDETLRGASNDPCQSALCATAKSRAASAYQPYSASDLRDCDYCPPGTGGADSYDPCAPGGRCDQLIQEAKAADIKFSGSQYPECQACPAFQAMTSAPRPMTDGTAEIAANGFAVKLTLPAATPFPLKANAFISIAGKSYDIPGGYTITGTAPTEAYILIPSLWSGADVAKLIIGGITYGIPNVFREILNRYIAFDFYIYQPSYDRTEYYAKFSYAGYTPTAEPIQLLSTKTDNAANFTLNPTPQFSKFPNTFSLHIYKNGVDIWDTRKQISTIPGIGRYGYDAYEREEPSLNPQQTFDAISVKYGETAVISLGNTNIPITGQSVTPYDDIRVALGDLIYLDRNAKITGRQQFVGSTAAADEPNMSGSLGLAGENTVAGEVSPAAPAAAKKFPMKMRIYVYAKDNSIRKTVDYTCKTVSTKFAISTTQATSTATPADSTITFEGQGNPAVSLGVALTTADTLALVIDDALTRPPTGSWPAGSQYFQSYSFTPPSFIEFAGRTTTGMRGLVKQTNSAATAGYRAIPAGATVEVVVQSSNNTTTLTATLPAGAPGASEFTIGFTTGNEEARVKVGTADISLGGTLYQYQSFSVTIKNPDGSVFAAGVNATGCDYAKCTEALGKMKAAKQPYNAADVPECKACLQTEVYNPCETPGGECIMEQKRLTDLPKKWTGSEILACQACGSMRDSKYDPCRSASCVAAKAQTASSYKKYTASDFEECNYCPPGTGGADTYDPCSASGDCETIQAALTASNRGWEGKDLKECQQCGSLKEKSFYPCFSEKCRTVKSQAASSYKGYSASDFDECDHCPPGTGGPDMYDPCSASGPCERRQAELTALGIAWTGADLKECKYCSNLAGSWAPPQPASASVPTASASVAPVAAPAPAAPTGGGIFAVFQGVVAPTPVAAAPRPPMPLKPIKPVPTYTPAVQERTVRIVVNEKKAAAAKAPVKRDFCVDGSKGFLANLVCEIREDVVGVGGKVKQAFGLF